MRKWSNRLLVVFIAVIMVFPLFFVLVGTLTGNFELDGLLGALYAEDGYAKWELFPMYPSFQNICEVLLDTPEIYVMLFNSLKVVVAVLAGQLLFGVPVTWFLARKRTWWSKGIFLVYIVCMLLPFQVTMLPQYITLNKIGVIGTHWALILPAMFSTFPVFIMYNSFHEVPGSVLEAARLDGAGEFRIFISIAVPIASKGILAALILGFLEYWNMIEQVVVFIKDKALWTMSVYLPKFESGAVGRSFAFACFSILMPFCVFYLGKNVLADGLSLGSVDD